MWYRYCESFFPFLFFPAATTDFHFPHICCNIGAAAFEKEEEAPTAKPPISRTFFAQTFFFFVFLFSRKGEEEASLLPIPNLPLLPFSFHFSFEVTTFDSPVSFRDKAGEEKINNKKT